MKVLVPLLLGCLRAEAAVKKAEEMGDEIVLCFVLPAEYTGQVSYPKLLFWALCGNWALTHYQARLKKQAKVVFRYGSIPQQLKKVFEVEGCDVVVLESWGLEHQKLINQLNLPIVTIFKTPQFNTHLPKGGKVLPVSPEKVYGQDPIDEYVWDIYSQVNDIKFRPPVDFGFMPEDWTRAFGEGLALDLYLQLGFFSDRDFLLNLLNRRAAKRISEQDFERLLKDFAHRAYILLKYDEPPKPAKEEWWAKRTSVNEHKIEDWCVRHVLKKLHTSGHLNNPEFVFITSTLSHHLKIKHDAILSIFEKHMLGYEPVIAAYNVLHITGLLEEHGYVVSDRYARTHGLCQHCDKYYGHCNMERRYAEWVASQERDIKAKKITDFSQ